MVTKEKGRSGSKIRNKSATRGNWHDRCSLLVCGSRWPSSSHSGFPLGDGPSFALKNVHILFHLQHLQLLLLWHQAFADCVPPRHYFLFERGDIVGESIQHSEQTKVAGASKKLVEFTNRFENIGENMRDLELDREVGQMQNESKSAQSPLTTFHSEA